jgi:mono/diheme cytochrome c family protein
MNKPRTLQVAVIGLSIFALAFPAKSAPPEKGPAKPDARQVERGRYLINLGGCHDCHSPKASSPRGPIPHPMKLLSGHQADAPIPAVPRDALGKGKWMALTNEDLTAWAGPWGVSFAANLTPDPGTGLGGWTEELFISTMRTGKHMGTGREILPPMPWQNLAEVNDQDLKDMFAYLRSLTPVKNLVPQPLPPSGGAR